MIIDATGWLHEPTPWAGLAACIGLNGDWWFPVRGTSATEAKTVCGTCPVRSDCLDYALRWDIRHGIWGGLSTRERQRLGRRQPPRRIPPPHGTTRRYAQGCRCDDCREANTFASRERQQAAEAK